MVARKFQFVLLTLGLSLAAAGLMVLAGAGAPSAGSAAEAAKGAPWRELATEAAASTKGGAAEVPGRPDAVVVVPSFADIAEQANPAVVNITATEIIRGRDRQRFYQGGPFEFFFPNPRSRPDDEDNPEREDHGGSGFIVSEDGYILTNHHVIEDADRVTVRLLGDNREYPAQKIGSDPDTDLALLKISANRSLPIIPLGDSERLRVGDWVLAIGNPLAYEHTVTVGVVSAKGRRLYAMNRDSSLDNFIQTDAAINRGNSGGPLLNARGEAIGINSAISVAGQGISFAIPINMAKDVMSQLVSTGRVSRGFLGVEIQDIARDLDPQTREYFKLDGRNGAFVEGVTRDLPADRAGLRRGDAILSVDGVDLESSQDLIKIISKKAPGEKVSLGILRDGEARKLTAELTDRAERATAPARSTRENDDRDAPREESLGRSLGIVLHELTPELRREYRIARDSGTGLVIVQVDPSSQAWEKGLREGDLITEVNGQSVADMASFRGLVSELRTGDLVNLYVARGGSARFVTLRVEERERSESP